MATVESLQHTIKHCLWLGGMPNQTFAYNKDLFMKWNEAMSRGLTNHGPFEEDSKPEMAYEKARRAYVDNIT